MRLLTLELQALQNQFAQESLNIQRNLEKQGGISEFRAGPLASLAKIDSIQAGRNAVSNSPFNQGIRGAQQSFREAEFLQNYFGQRDIPEPVINQLLEEEPLKWLRWLEKQKLGEF